ncbi:MAG TPA: O-antigen ligase family protein, partial [Terriglobales bacterium]|nr:O-antigen ligase family protein [Terriglobales bacterium]
ASLLLGAFGIAAFAGLSALTSNGGPTLILWAAVSPLGYHYLSLPQQQPIFTLDRLVIGVLVLAGVLATKPKVPISPSLRYSALAWAGFVFAAALSLASVTNLASSARLLVEAFVFPLILGWAMLRSFDADRYAPLVHIAVCVVSIYSAAIGVAEILTLQDLLPIAGASLYLDTGIGIPRANGPFQTNNSFALIGVTSFLLLQFLRRMLASRVRRWQTILHIVGSSGALLMAMLPMFRSVALTLLALLGWEAFRSKGVRRIALTSLIIAATAMVLWVGSLAPDAFEERVSSNNNVYARLAQQKQTLELFLSHPVLGVGINNFFEAVPKTTNYSALFAGADPLDYPHNNLAAVLAETGVLGFMPYMMAQAFLVKAFWDLRKRKTAAANEAWRYFCYIFVGYWASGMTLTSGYYSDLNLWFMFAVIVVYSFGVSEASSCRPLAGAVTSTSHALFF